MPALRRLRRLGLLLAAALVLALGASCGSGETPEPQPTETSSRAERTQSVAQQAQQAEQTAAAERDEPAADDPRAGLLVSRNVVGDPEAPVLIVEYSDFQ